MITSEGRGRTDRENHGGGCWVVGRILYPDLVGYTRIHICEKFLGFAFGVINCVICVLYLTYDDDDDDDYKSLCRVIQVICGRVSLNPDSLTSESVYLTTTL